MKIFKRILFGLVVLVLVAAAAAFFYGRHLARRALPDYSTDVRLAGMKEDVIVYRDEFAVPHIFAGNDEDLYRATGYVMAQDRLWQMDLIRRATAGRLSEIQRWPPNGGSSMPSLERDEIGWKPWPQDSGITSSPRWIAPA